MKRAELAAISVLIALVLSMVPWAAAQTTSEDDAAANKNAETKSEKAARANLPTISVEQEKEVLAFVSTHDTSLNGLLGNLRKSRPLEYQKALADLFRVTQRLAQVKRNRPHAYELEVKKWQAQSNVQVLAAQLATNPNPQTKASLRQAIESRADLELQILQADREAAAKRLKQLDEQIATGEKNRLNRIQQQFDRSVAASRRARLQKGDAPKKRPSSEESIPVEKEGAAPKSTKREGAGP